VFFRNFSNVVELTLRGSQQIDKAHVMMMWHHVLLNLFSAIALTKL
jgi:hypothetical protein